MKRSIWLIYLVSSEISNSAIIHSSILQELTYLKKKKQRISKLICNDMSRRCLGLPKIKIFWNQDFTKKVLSRDSKYIVYVVMSEKFRNSSVSMKEVF